MVSNIFWALVALDTVALGVLAILAARGPTGPEGPVGAWILLIPPVVLAALVATVLTTKSNAARITGIVLLTIPWVVITVGPGYAAFEKYRNRQSSAGDDFAGKTRDLAHAITAHDLELVKSLIPQVGDLNRPGGDDGDTMLLFAIDKARDPAKPDEPVAAGLAIVEALLNAGANPNQAKSGHYWPLTAAMFGGPELTLMLVKAGANPNQLDDGMPLWWQILSNDSDRGIETLRILLDHGADIELRDSESGPVGFAASSARSLYTSRWRATWMLVERGAAWKDEQRYGQSVPRMLAFDFEQRQHKEPTMPEAMQKLQAKYASQ
jgi:hypothetical protein